MPTLGFHLPDDSPLLDAVKHRADTDHDGKVSAYVRAAVERDLKHYGPDGNASVDEAILEFMAKVRPDLAFTVAQSGLSPADRTRIASAVAQAIAGALGPRTITPGQPLMLVDAECYSEAQKAALVGLNDIAAALILMSSGNEFDPEGATNADQRDVASFRARWETYFGISDRSQKQPVRAKDIVPLPPMADVPTPATPIVPKTDIHKPHRKERRERA